MIDPTSCNQPEWLDKYDASKHCWRTNTTFTEPFSMTQHPTPERLHSVTSGGLYISFMHGRNNFSNILKTIYGPTISRSSPVFRADGNSLITDKEKIFKYWAEHLHSILNWSSVINGETITHLPQVPCNNSLAEVENTIRRMSSGKALDSDFIPAEVYAVSGPQLIW